MILRHLLACRLICVQYTRKAGKEQEGEGKALIKFGSGLVISSGEEGLSGTDKRYIRFFRSRKVMANHRARYKVMEAPAEELSS